MQPKGPEAACQGEVAGKEMSKSGLPGGVSRFTLFWPDSSERPPSGRSPGRENAAAAVYGASRPVGFSLILSHDTFFSAFEIIAWHTTNQKYGKNYSF